MNHRLESASKRLETALSRYLQDNFTVQQSGAEEVAGLSFRHLVKPVDLLPQVALFEQKIRRAKAAIGLTRNCSTQIVPIHRLPPELLERIFHHLVATESCMLDETGQLPKRALRISLVCTYWRRIALASPNLWSHIDISIRILKDNRAISRIQTFLSRSGHTDLDLHVRCATYDDDDDDSEDQWEDQVNVTLGEFVAPLVPRIGGLKCSMELSSPSEQDFKFYQSVVSHFLNKNTTPRRLTTLDINVNSYYRTFDLQTTEHSQNNNTLLLDMPAHHLEDLLLPVTALRLSNISPHWKSKAFHGLVDLRLYALGDSLGINDLELVTILTYSPQLRVFEFGIKIEFTNTMLEPVTLNSLEVLVTHIRSYSQLGRFLRLLKTGSNPLFMSIDSPYMDDELNDNVAHFFTNSNVTKLCAIHFENFSQSFELVNLSHTVKKLAVTPPGNFPWNLDSQSDLFTRVHLDALYLIGSFELEVNQLQGIAGGSSVRKLKIWGLDYQFTRGGRPIMNKQLLKKELSNLGLDVEILSPHAPCPIDMFQL